MFRKILRAKIHRATVTETDLDYVGSITIDRDLMDAASVTDSECVLVANLANGTRHETYVIPGERGSGTICINGAAAHLVSAGDKIIILCFGLMDEAERVGHRPRVIVVGQDNRPAKVIE